MEKQKRISPSSGGELPAVFRTLERTARDLFGAVLPGMFLGAVLAAAFTEFRGGGVFAIPGVPVAVVALEAIFGAVLVGSWRERHDLRGILILPALLLFLFSLFPGPRPALAVGGVLLGGYLAALPFRDGRYRLLFGAAFALTVFLRPENPSAAALLPVMLLPLLFGAAILWVRTHWLFRLGLIVLLPVAAVLFTRGMLLNQPEPPMPEPKETATALPAVLMANSDASKILFLSERSSLLPEIWGGMPFVATIESIRPQPRGDYFAPELWSKLHPHAGPPGKIVASLADRYQLIYVDTLPGGSEAARRGFVEKLWELLDARNGVLVLPAVNRLLLPVSAQWAVLPGSGGTFVAASREGVATDLELLDGRLQALLGSYGEDHYIPAGLMPALYYVSAPPVLPEPEGEPFTGASASPRNFWAALVCLLAGYAVIRFYFRRFGRNSWGFGLAENGAAFVLVLLAAFDAMSHRELFSGISATMILGCAGIAFFPLRLRPRAGRLLISGAVLLPALWFLPWSVTASEAAWIAVTVVVALAAAAARSKFTEESGFPRSWSTTFSAVGWIAGAAVYAIFALLLRGEPLLPALVTAAVLRAAWPLEL